MIRYHTAFNSIPTIKGRRGAVGQHLSVVSLITSHGSDCLKIVFISLLWQLDACNLGRILGSANRLLLNGMVGRHTVDGGTQRRVLL